MVTPLPKLALFATFMLGMTTAFLLFAAIITFTSNDDDHYGSHSQYDNVKNTGSLLLTNTENAYGNGARTSDVQDFVSRIGDVTDYTIVGDTVLFVIYDKGICFYGRTSPTLSNQFVAATSKDDCTIPKAKILGGHS